MEARPKSGFYIRKPVAKLIPEPHAGSSQRHPAGMGTNAVLEAVIRSASDPAYISFGAGCASAQRNYDFPPGIEAFGRQIARRSLTIRCEVAPRDVVVTAVALEAINLCLRAAAEPGDLIAVESRSCW